jgi:DNA-directed RNA polymerase subunit RPC12/RpoP
MEELTKIKYECLNCGKILSKNNYVCPFCGGKKRKIYIKLTGSLSFLRSLKGKAKNASNFIIYKFKSLTKISGKSKNLARELLVFDRTNKKYTKKCHEVKEFIKGAWKVVHRHLDNFESKRRRS